MSDWIEIQEVDDPAQVNDWDELVDSSPEPNPMMLAGWHGILKSVFAVRPLYLRAVHKDQSLGVMALYHARSLLAGNVLRGMDGTTATRKNGNSELIAKAMSWAKKHGVAYCQFRCPVAGITDARVELKVHTRVALANGASAIWNRISSNTRRKVRKAGKLGYEVITSEHIPSEFATIYLRRQRDLGTPSPQANLFQAMNEHLSGRLVFLAVKRGQELLGGAVLLCAGSVWLNLYTAVEPEAQLDYASYLLYWNMIEHAVAEGGTILDLGRSRPESGTHRFKLPWASDDLIRQYTLFPVCGKIPAVSLDKSAGFKHEIWKRLPLQIAGPAGGFLRRSIPFA